MSSVERLSARSRRDPLVRHPDRGLIGGVCVGLAEHFNIDITLARLVVTLLIAVGGIGVAVYALAWALIPIAPESALRGRPPGALRRAILAFGAVACLLFAVRTTGLRFAEALIWPLVLGACGMALVWRPTVGTAEGLGSDRRLSLRGLVRRARRIDAPRLIIGGLLVTFASAALLHSAGVLHSLGSAVGTVAIVAALLGLGLAPWILRLWRSLSAERAARIREQERAELGAHLHDSVLQTLALIQKRSGDPREVAGLARRQERELRRWLLEGRERGASDSVAGALERAAAEVEELHRVPIEVVTVGDGPLTDRLEAIVQAAREAMTNAAKFAGCERVDLYAEVEADRVEVFVRDRGVGFDPAEIPADRRGVRDSIIARMERHRGRAAVHSTPGQGTEVELVMERGSVG
jgi:signal transduction histidine kinase